MLACRLCLIHITDLTSAQRSNIPSGQTSCRPMHSIWTLDIGRETIGNKTLQRRANVEPISRANVDPMSKMATGQRWYSTSNQRQRRPLTDVGPTSLCRLGMTYKALLRKLNIKKLEPTTIWGELRFSGRISSSCSTTTNWKINY